MAKKSARPLWVEESEKKPASGTPYVNKRVENEAMNTSVQHAAKAFAGAVQKNKQERGADTVRSSAAPLSLPTFQQFRAQQQQRPVQMVPLATPKMPTFFTPKNAVVQDAVRAVPAGNLSTGRQFAESMKQSVQNLDIERANGPAYQERGVIHAPSRAEGILQAQQMRRALNPTPDEILGSDDVADYIRRRDEAARNLQGLSFGDVLKDPMYAAGTLLDNLDYGITDVGRRIFNPDKAEEIDRRVNAYNEATGYKPDAVTATVNRGAANFNASVGDTLDFLVGENLKRLGWKDNPVSGFADALRSDQAVIEGNYQRVREDQSKAGQVAMDVGAGAVEALPDMVLMMLSAGTSGAGALTKGGGRLLGWEAAGEAAAQTSKLAGMRELARQVSISSAKNPAFWTSFTRTTGNSYYDARANGATEQEASLYALLNGVLNSWVEAGSGFQKLPSELKKGGSALRAWVKSMVEEGNEEVVQGLIERGLQNLTYDAGNPLLPTKSKGLGAGSKITPSVLGTSDCSELVKLGEGGNVDLTTRPVIDSKLLGNAGWDAGDGLATIYTSTFSDQAGSTAMNFTPIVVDQKGEVTRVLSPKELEVYAERVIDGTQEDYLHLKVGATFTGKTAISEAENAAERIHEIHENAISGNTNRTAIFDPKAALSEFAMGAAVAGILGAPSSVNQGIYNLRTGQQAAQESNVAPKARADQNAEPAAPKATEETSAQTDNAYLPAARIVARLQSGQNVSNNELNNVMRTPEFAALYQSETGKTLPSGLTNAQLRAAIREDLSGSGNASAVTANNDVSEETTFADDGSDPWERILDQYLEPDEDASQNLENREGGITLVTKDGEERIAGPKPLDSAEAARAAVETEQAAQRDYELRRGDQPQGVNVEENDQSDITPQPLQRGDDPAYAAARAAAQPDAVTQSMTDAEKAEYARRLLDAGVEENEVFRRVYGSNHFAAPPAGAETSTASPDRDSSPALAKLGVKISSPIAENTNRKSVVEGNRAARKADRKLKARIKALNPSRAEMEFAQGISNGTYSEADIPLSMDSKKVKELAGLYSAAENNTGFFVRQIRRNIKRGVRERLDGLFVSADGVQVPRIFSMNLNTPQRIIRKMFKGEAGEKINSYLFDPVLDNSAEKIRFMNRMLDRVREFKLSKSERVLVARVLEGRAAQKEFSLLEPDMQKRVDAVAKSENPGVTRSEYGLQNNDDAFQLALRYKAWLNTQARLEGQDAGKINKAADAYAEAYNDFYDGINDFLVNHGYEPIGFIQGYTPHMQTDEAKTGLSGVLQRLGLDPEVGLLPTEIAGRTDTFRPGKQWNPYFLQRTTGDPDTDYDAVEGYESYVNYMANVLYHTDDIMKLRETGNYFRTRYAKDQVRDLIEEARDIANKTTEEKVRLLIRENKLAPGSVLTDEQADTQLEAYIDSLYQDAKDMKKFGEFVSWLDDYTNRLAGKQTKLDRSIESFVGRRFLNLGNKLTKIFGESTIVGNLSSALNQTAQIPMLIREVGNINTITAVKDIITGETRRGNWSTESDFLTGKRGVDYISEPSGYQKVMDFASIPFEAVDDVTSQLYVRAKYVQCIKQGMDHDAAMKAADKFATEMVGSRIQGAKPMVFESKNVFVKVLTTFQLEIANNWAYISQDLPAQYQQFAKQNGTAKAAAKVAGDTLKYLISAWLMNWLADELYGGSPAPLDIIGTAFDSLGAGKGLTGNEYMLRAFDNLVEGLTGERKLGTDEMPEGFDGKQALDEFIYNAGRDLPYLNNALSVAGISDSRMPLPSVPINTVKDAANLLSSDESTREKAKQRIGSDALKEFKSWVPLGNQAYKTYTGAKALLRGGSFSGAGDNEQMQYQMPRNLLTGAKALMFGANSTKPARDWFASGYDSLSVKETNAFKMLTGDGIDEQTAYAVMRQLHGVNAEDGTQANAEKRKIITNANISDDLKRQLFASTFGDGRQDELQALADAGLTFKQSMQAYDEYLRLSGEEGNTASGNATDFAAWADRQGYTSDQTAAVKDAFKFWMNMPAEADRYESFTAEGLSTDDAQLVATTLSGLEPEPGRTYVSAIQNYNAIVSLNISDDAKGSAMRALMDDGIRQKFDLTQNIGVTPEQYVMCYQATLDLKEATGKSSVNQGMAKAAVDSIPGLTTEQRAVLWQIQNKSWKPSSNPYDPRVGAIVATLLNEKPENINLS